jgi:hypothetical protein
VKNLKGPVIVKQIPERQGKLHRGLFLDEIKHLVGNSYRPRLVIDLPAGRTLKTETIDLLLECVEELEHVDGRVSVVVAEPESAVLLELTRLTSVLDLFPSIAEATGEMVPYVISPGESASGQIAA